MKVFRAIFNIIFIVSLIILILDHLGLYDTGGADFPIWGWVLWVIGFITNNSF